MGQTDLLQRSRLFLCVPGGWVWLEDGACASKPGPFSVSCFPHGKGRICSCRKLSLCGLKSLNPNTECCQSWTAPACGAGRALPPTPGGTGPGRRAPPTASAHPHAPHSRVPTPHVPTPVSSPPAHLDTGTPSHLHICTPAHPPHSRTSAYPHVPRFTRPHSLHTAHTHPHVHTPAPPHAHVSPLLHIRTPTPAPLHICTARSPHPHSTCLLGWCWPCGGRVVWEGHSRVEGAGEAGVGG